MGGANADIPAAVDDEEEEATVTFKVPANRLLPPFLAVTTVTFEVVATVTVSKSEQTCSPWLAGTVSKTIPSCEAFFGPEKGRGDRSFGCTRYNSVA